ncbi:MAG: PQQ-binding-like beta-propeller repeat protein [Pseudomonadota bacterium]
MFARTKYLLLTLLLVSFQCFAQFGGPVIIPDTTNWLSYNGNVNGQRFVLLNQITTENAKDLGKVCSLKVDKIGSFHTGILHIDGTLFFTTATDTLAVDSKTCKLKWRHHHEEEELEINTIRVNRGVAYSNGILYRGTVDSFLLAIDAKTGETVWAHQIGDPQVGEFFSSSPQIYQGLVIVGAAGSDWGIKGRIMAYDAETGKEVWRFNTIPREGEPGAESWVVAGSARFGGGGTWTTYTIDMSEGEVFVPVGNPSPDLLPDTRPGENLYTDSLVVLDANTGKLKWYHQLLGNDGQDLDLGAAPVLYYNGKGERMVGFGSKDGFLYAVNRETKERIFRTQITTVKNAGVKPTTEGVEICPGPLGGVEWNGPAYDKQNKAMIVGTVDWCSILTAQKEEYVYEPGKFSFGGSLEFVGTAKGWVYSVDGDTGEVKWKRQTEGPMVAGITPTASGVTFTGDLAGNFTTYDSKNGKVLYETKVDGGLAGGVVTYMRDAKQYVAFVSGNVSRLTFGNAGSPTINVYSLGGAQTSATETIPSEAATVSTTESDGEEKQTNSGQELGAENSQENVEELAPEASASVPSDAPNSALGQITYAQVCASCHGMQGEGGIGPKLAGAHDRLGPEKMIEWIKNPSEKMPKLFPSMIGEQEVIDVTEFLKRLN